MPFAPKIRKDILNALDDFIIPALQTQKVLQVLAEPPYDFSSVQHWTEQGELLPDRPHAPLQVERNWKNEHMVSVRHPAFGFAYQGVGYESIGITEAIAAKMRTNECEIPAGITIVELPAPGIICYPSYSPHADGALRRQPKNIIEDVRVLCFSLIENNVLAFISTRNPHQRETTHHLQVSDSMLAQMGKIYLDELRQPNNRENAQAQLLIFMCRLKRYLQNHKAAISNSCWVDPTETSVLTLSSMQAKHAELCSKIRDYIQTHLSEPLSLPLLATQFGVSTVHLNRVFQEVQGITIMRYVTSLRIEVAKKIITETPERISDVAELTGFSSTASFCTVFRNVTGISPGDFRELSKNSMAETVHSQLIQ